jgi:2-oxoglutarate ferredoxin oxidoreductase subunit alpha
VKKSHDSVFTIGIGGAAGDGIRESGATVGAILTELGYHSYFSFTYPSLIRGGHNFARISFSKDKVNCDHTNLDVLIALNEESIVLHRQEMAKDSVVFADAFEKSDIDILGDNAVVVPMANTVKELNASPIMRNSMALGALCYLIDLDYAMMQTVLNKVFKNKQPEMNIKLADMGYDLMKAKNFRHSKKIEPSKSNLDFSEGNTSLGRGLANAGLDFYLGYPMTPTTSLLQFLASQQKDTKIRVIQPESELSVINMALGISYAGKRVAVGSATGGFALMQEAFSFAGIAELPLVVVVSQRQGPATGLPTYSSQTDLRYVVHAGHGEFPKIVIAPGDIEEAYYIGAQALNLAWQYQVPVIVLMDKLISEHSSSCILDQNKIKIEKGNVLDNADAKYGRYQITPDGISPMVFPGTPNAVVKITSYEHDEAGITVEDPQATETMLNKRFQKTETIKSVLPNFETIKVYGDTNSKNVLLFWGSTKGAVLEAYERYLDLEVKMIQVVWMEPFDTERLTKELKGAKNIINIECNHNGQMAGLLKEKTGISPTHNILKYNARPFDPEELATEIEKLLATRI